MFADSLLEVSWAQRTRRSWTTITSFALQAMVISLSLLLPLWKTVGLPRERTVSTPIAIGRPSAEPTSRPRNAGASAVQSTPMVARIVAPGRVPPSIVTDAGEASGPPPGEIGNGLEGTGLPMGAPDGLPLSIISGTRPVLPAAPAAIVRPFRTSTMLEGSLIRRVQPIYPPLARSAHIQGMVVLSATISKAGAIEDLHVLSGHPMLVKAALEAVSQWRYRPYILNNEAIEVETQVTVNFILSGN